MGLRTLLLERRSYRDLTLFDAVSGGPWERGLFRLFLEHKEVFSKLPGYAHEALVAAHLRHATHIGFRPGILDALLAPWRGGRGAGGVLPSVQPDQAGGHGRVRAVAEQHLDSGADRLGPRGPHPPPQYAEWLHERAPQAELHWIEGAGHLLQEDAPGRCWPA